MPRLQARSLRRQLGISPGRPTLQESAKTLLSHYRIVSKLGAGGIGEVYLAEDSRLDRRVALKLLLSEFVAMKTDSGDA